MNSSSGVNGTNFIKAATPSSQQQANGCSPMESLPSGVKVDSISNEQDVNPTRKVKNNNGVVRYDPMTPEQVVAFMTQEQMVLLKENAELSMQVASIRGKRDNVQQELLDSRDELETTRRSLQSQISSLQSEVSSLQMARDLQAALSLQQKSSASENMDRSRKQHGADATSQELQQLKEELQSRIERETQLEKELLEAKELNATIQDQLKESQRQLKERQQSHIEREAQLENELLAAQEQHVTTSEHLQESQRQVDQMKTEVEVSESDSGHATDSKVALLHTQRADLVQRIKQLLNINGKFRASSVHLRQRIRQRDIIVDALKQAYTEVKSESQLSEVMLERQILEWRNRTAALEQELRGCQQKLAATKKRSMRTDMAPYIEQIEELKQENVFLMEQLKRRQENWDHQKSLLRREISALESRLRTAPNQTKTLARTAGKRDHTWSPSPTFDESIHSCDQTGNTTPLSVLTDDTAKDESRYYLPITGRREECLPHNNNGGSNTTMIATLQAQIRLMEAQLKDKDTREISLIEEVTTLRHSFQKAQREVRSAEERAELLQTYLDIR